MHCSWVAERLVALSDDELSRSEEALVVEHLEHCDACAELAARLDSVTPEDALIVAPATTAHLAAAVDDALDRVFAEQAAQPWDTQDPGLFERTRRWLRRDRDLSNGAMLAYAAVLAIFVGWGLSNYLAVQALQEEVPQTAAATASVSNGHYQPASWAVEDEAEEGEEEWR